MPLSCDAYGCSNHNEMTQKHGFFRFPNNDPDLRERWVNACRRKNKDGRMCIYVEIISLQASIS